MVEDAGATTLLRVDGEVEREQALTFADLAALPAQIADVSVLIAGREGRGVRFDAILHKAGVRDGATHVSLTATDGRFSASVPLAAVRDAVIVYQLAAQPLPVSKGGPVRFLIPNVEECAFGGVDACANVKFLGHVRLTRGSVGDTRPQSEAEHRDLHRHEA